MSAIERTRPPQPKDQELRNRSRPRMSSCCEHQRFLCSYSYAEHRVDADPELRAIIDGWYAIDGATTRCDRKQAEAALAAVFAGSGRRCPAVRWWVCPIAMLVAHDVEVLGLRSARMMHGPDVFDLSDELAQWLDRAEVEMNHLGVPVSVQSIMDRAQHSPRGDWGGAAVTRSRLASLLATWAVPLGMSRDVEQGILDALESSPTVRNAAWYSGRSESVLWPGAVARDLLEWQLAAALGDTPNRSPILDAAVDLARNVHLAILRERECWLCDRPVATDYGVIDVIGSIGCIGAGYADGPRIAVNAGPSAQRRNASLRAIFSL